MNTGEWKSYYTGMIKGGIRPEKVPEMIARCGGVLVTKVLDEKTLRTVEKVESIEDAKVRLVSEIKVLPFKVGD